MRTYGKLREEIKKKYKTLDEFAMAMGMSRCSFSKKLNGKVSWTGADIDKACDILEIPSAKVGEFFFY